MLLFKNNNLQIYLLEAKKPTPLITVYLLFTVFYGKYNLSSVLIS